MDIEIPYRNWRPREYQQGLWDAMVGGCKRAVTVWHRRAGKDATSLNFTVRAAFTEPGLYWHLAPTLKPGRRIIWNGKQSNGKPFMDCWPMDIEGVVVKKREDEMMLELCNGSIWQVVGGDDPDALRGPNPRGVVLTEFPLMDPGCFDVIRPILAENGGWAIFPYTPLGRNHGYSLYNRAVKDPAWYAELLSVEDTKRPDGNPVITPEAVQAERDSGMEEEIVQQEFYCSFDAPLKGSYFGDQMTAALDQGRIGTIPYQPEIPVHTAWDLGVGDANVIWFFQQIHHEIHLIDLDFGSGKGAPEYVGILQEKARDRGFVYGRHLFPHDIRVREWGTNRSRAEQLRSLGIEPEVIPRLALEDGIDATRAVLSRCWFDAEHCERGIEALRQYRKEFDEKLKVYRDKPLHDWTSHFADAMRGLSLSVRDDVGIPGDPLRAATRHQPTFDDIIREAEMSRDDRVRI
jgi:hypothetical protein